MSANVYHPEALERARADLLDALDEEDRNQTLNAWFAVHRLIQQKHRVEAVAHP